MVATPRGTRAMAELTVCPSTSSLKPLEKAVPVSSQKPWAQVRW